MKDAPKEPRDVGDQLRWVLLSSDRPGPIASLTAGMAENEGEPDLERALSGPERKLDGAEGPPAILDSRYCDCIGKL